MPKENQRVWDEEEIFVSSEFILLKFSTLLFELKLERCGNPRGNATSFAKNLRSKNLGSQTFS